MIQSNLIFPGFLWNVWIHAKFYLIVFVPEIRYFWLKYFSGFVVVVFFEGEGGKYMPMIETSNSAKKNAVSHFLSLPRVFPQPPGQLCIHKRACVCVCVCVCEYISPWLSWLFSLCFCCCNALIVWSSVWITGQLWEGAELGFILHSCRRN